MHRCTEGPEKRTHGIPEHQWSLPEGPTANQQPLQEAATRHRDLVGDSSSTKHWHSGGGQNREHATPTRTSKNGRCDDEEEVHQEQTGSHRHLLAATRQPRSTENTYRKVRHQPLTALAKSATDNPIEPTLLRTEPATIGSETSQIQKEADTAGMDSHTPAQWINVENPGDHGEVHK